MKILVAVDDSASAQAVIRGLASYLKTDEAEVRILHVMPPIVFSLPPEEARGYAPEMEEERKRARTLVDKYTAQLRGEGYKTEPVVESGDPVETIVGIVERWKADLLMLGSHGRKGIARLLLGSVAYAVVRRANCSVLVYRLPSS